MSWSIRARPGPPVDQLRKRGYGWLAETPLDHHLTAAIVDVADVVATHWLTAGDTETAKWAAERAILAAPAGDEPKLDLAAALTASGDQARADNYLDDEIARSDDRGAPSDLTGGPARCWTSDDKVVRAPFLAQRC